MVIRFLSQKKSVFSNHIKGLIKKEVKNRNLIKNEPLENLSIKKIFPEILEEEVVVEEEELNVVPEEEDQDSTILIE